MSCSFPRAGLTWAQDSFRIKVPKTCNEGLTPRPFLFSDGRIHRISIRKVMKSGAPSISKHISFLAIVHSVDGKEACAVTERGTTVSTDRTECESGKVLEGVYRRILSIRRMQPYLREGRSFTYPNPDNPFIRSAAAMPAGYKARSRRTPFSTACRTIILCP